MKSSKKIKNVQQFATIGYLIFTFLSSFAMAEPREDEALGYSIKGDKESPNVLYFVPLSLIHI